mmetsp:Transcript_35665/g.45801  ORF Transcript_35665/g.45801 Transcript_35665/m.45801 type:complete len:112 (+) Transcript_35665:216-551(+)
MNYSSFFNDTTMSCEEMDYGQFIIIDEEPQAKGSGIDIFPKKNVSPIPKPNERGGVTDKKDFFSAFSNMSLESRPSNLSILSLQSEVLYEDGSTQNYQNDDMIFVLEMDPH